ncbi:MAG: hypothetical protein ACRD6W_12300 [Nitrososphaerales archaeon]
MTDGQSYQVKVEGYGSYYFQYWQGSGSVNSRQTVTPSASLSLTAVLCNGPPGTCSEPTPVDGITVYVHRIAASYWEACFATTCVNPGASCDLSCTGPGAAMWVSLENAAGKVLQSGLANEAGITFTGLSPGTTYYVYPSDCDLCHGSTHDVLFQYWGADTSTVRPLAVSVGTSLDAWFSCTNGCA